MNLDADPLVTVVIPTYNAGEYLRPAVESVLSQTYRDIQVLVVDDGSTDGCLETLDGLCSNRLVVRKQTNTGKSSVLNRVIETSSARFLVVQDADDLAYPHRVERIVQAFERDAELGAVLSGYDLMVGQQRFAPRLRPRSKSECRADIERLQMPGHDATVAFRMSAIRDLRYDTQLRICQGLDFILQVGERSAIECIGDCLYTHRVNMNSNCRRRVAQLPEALGRVTQRALERRGLPPLGASDRIGLTNLDVNHLIASHCRISARDLCEAGRRREALRVAVRCIRIAPRQFRFYVPLAVSVLPQWILAALRALSHGIRRFRR